MNVLTMKDDLKVAAWNVRRLRDPHRALIVKRWLKKFYPTLDILCLQEVQAVETTVTFHLQSVMPQGKVFVDSIESGRVGAAIVASPQLQILDHGIKGDGTFVCFKVDTVKGPVFVASIYAPVDRYKMLQLWSWLSNFMYPEDNWLIQGDWNMVEFYEDSAGTTCFAHGAEARRWAQVLDKFDLIDLYFCASRRRGPWCTRQAWSGSRYDRSRLDRFYSSNSGSWFQYVRNLDHDSRQTLSDHWPIVASIVLSSPTQT
jgi:exonuclease III